MNFAFWNAIANLFTKRPRRVKVIDLSSLTRPVDKLIVHCTATPPGMDIGVKEVRRWHKEKGWSDIGYHFVIRRNGQVEVGRPINKVGAHCKGQNTGSIGIALVGGVDYSNKAEDNFTAEQYQALTNMVRYVKEAIPPIIVDGHNKFSSKACPSFSVSDWIEETNL